MYITVILSLSPKMNSESTGLTDLLQKMRKAGYRNNVILHQQTHKQTDPNRTSRRNKGVDSLDTVYCMKNIFTLLSTVSNPSAVRSSEHSGPPADRTICLTSLRLMPSKCCLTFPFDTEEYWTLCPDNCTQTNLLPLTQKSSSSH